MRTRALWVVPVALLLVVDVAWGQTVKVSAWGPPTTETFPPEKPPGDLAEGEAADATPFATVIGAGHLGAWDAATNTYTVNKVGDIGVSGHTRSRLPTDADDTLKGHERGHDDLNKSEYDKNAKRKVDEAFKGFNGMKFTGEGTTDAARQADAVSKAGKERDKRLQQAQDAILHQTGTLNDKYDTLTKHGTSDKVSTDEGKKMAIAERDKAPGAGGHGFIPDLNRPFGLGQLVAGLTDDGTRLLLAGVIVPSSFVLTETAFLDDPLTLFGEVTVDPMVVIGLTGTDAVHLSDTRLRIIHAGTDAVLLNGFLFEVAYMPATVLGFAAMIQGFLDIPPPGAPGVNNTIDSRCWQRWRAWARAARAVLLGVPARAAVRRGRSSAGGAWNGGRCRRDRVGAGARNRPSSAFRLAGVRAHGGHPAPGKLGPAFPVVDGGGGPA